jgi:8-oxo-dGTP diphosphatase
MKLLAIYDDPFWEDQSINTIRYTSRVFLRNQAGQIAFLKIVGEDALGKRNHLETCGGGVEANESFIEAAEREIMEELGAIAKDFTEIGCVIWRLNRLSRISIETYFEAQLVSLSHHTNRTDEEKTLIEQVIWLSETEALERLSIYDSAVDFMVHRRDLTALKALLKID